MKELSIEQKAKRYDDLLVKLQEAKVDNNVCDDRYCCVIDDIVPELKESEDESEDEKIRKEIIDIIDSYDVAHLKAAGLPSRIPEYIAWLKEQGEQKSQEEVDNLHNYLYGEQEPADKVEPKFKVGDFIANDYCRGKVVALTNDAYLLDTGQGIPFSCEHNIHLWTIQDAKAGDVLMGNAPFIFNGNLESGVGCPGAYCGINTLGNFEIPEHQKHWTGHNTQPATKEQRDTLIKAMADAGYIFDFEKIVLKKIEQKPAWSEEDEKIYNKVIKHLTSYYYSEKVVVDWVKSLKDRVQSQPQQEWSEEDESLRRRCIGAIDMANLSDYTKDSLLNWLKSLKDRVQTKPKQEWSKDDEKMFNGIIEAATHHCYLNITDIDWLKSLKERYTWKPSDEQMQALSNAGNSFRPFEEGHKVLWSLYNDLKKLKGE